MHTGPAVREAGRLDASQGYLHVGEKYGEATHLSEAIAGKQKQSVMFHLLSLAQSRRTRGFDGISADKSKQQWM